MKKIIAYISRWLNALVGSFAGEFKAVFSDVGVLIFFFALPTLYPIVYTLIYNPEIASNIPVTIVDKSRSQRSRELVRMIDATQSMHVIGYATDLPDARRSLEEHKSYAIIEIPEDYSRQIGSGGQAVVPFYCDVSLLLRYRSILSSMTDIQLQLGTEIRANLIGRLGAAGQVAMGSSKQVQTEALFLGDTTQGFASFVMPGILVLILQQSMVLGVCMLAGGRAEKRRRGLLGPEPSGTTSARMIGRMLCYVTCYAPMMIYIFTVVPWLFDLPSVGNLLEYCLYIFPMLVASAFFGMLISVFVTERESSMMVVVFSSIIFLFLSGLTWPRYAMSDFWYWISNCVPATWGVEGFVRMASDGGTIAEQSHPYHMMWILAAVYFLLAYPFKRYVNK